MLPAGDHSIGKIHELEVAANSINNDDKWAGVLASFQEQIARGLRREAFPKGPLCKHFYRELA